MPRSHFVFSKVTAGVRKIPAGLNRAAGCGCANLLRPSYAAPCRRIIRHSALKQPGHTAVAA